MKNRFNSITFLAIGALMLAFVSPAMAVTMANTSNGADDTVAPPASVTSVPGSIDQTGNGADDAVAPPVVVTSTSGSAAQTTNGADDVSAPASIPPVTPPVTPPGGGGSTGGGSSYSGGSSSSGGSVVTLANSPVALGVMTSSCPLITDYLKLGGTNNPAQVTNLQIFLKNSEKLNVDVNGKFDQKTEDAVKSFQLKYLPTILGPWDATRATGFVYITTLKKINQLACASPLTLSAEEQANIAAYKARGTVEQSSEVVTPGTSNATGTLEVGTTDNSQTVENTAAVANTSIVSRFWNFIKNLFK